MSQLVFLSSKWFKQPDCVYVSRSFHDERRQFLINKTEICEFWRHFSSLKFLLLTLNTLMLCRQPQQTSSGASTPRWSNSSSSTAPPSCRRPVQTSRPWAQRSCCWPSAGSNRREPTLLLLRRTEEQQQEEEERRPGNDKQMCVIILRSSGSQCQWSSGDQFIQRLTFVLVHFKNILKAQII